MCDPSTMQIYAAWLAGSLTINAIFLLLSFARWLAFHNAMPSKADPPRPESKEPSHGG